MTAEGTTELLGTSDADVARAGALLRTGGLVAIPTETVYGLGADATSADAVARVFTAKGRPADNPLIAHLADPSHVDRVAVELTPLARELAARCWPGPVTLVLAARGDLPPALTGGLTTVAVRVPDHPVARAVIAAAGVPVAAPSANRSGRPSPTTAAHVLADLGGVIDAVVDGGPCDVGVESTVVDVRGDEAVVLRPGGLAREGLTALLAASGHRVADGPGDVAASPGTRHRHYRPRCEVVVAPVGGSVQLAAELAAAGRRVGLVGPRPAPTATAFDAAPGTSSGSITTIAVLDGERALARGLYAALRDGETAGVDVLVVEAVPATGVGRAVMDRLQRAAGRDEQD